MPRSRPTDSTFTPFTQHLAPGRREQAGHGLEDRGLAAARGAEEDDDLAVPRLVGDVERHVANRLGPPAVAADVGDAEVLDLHLERRPRSCRLLPPAEQHRRTGADQRSRSAGRCRRSRAGRRTTTTPSGGCAPVRPCSRGRAPGSPPRRGSRRSRRWRSSPGTSRRSRAAPPAAAPCGPPASATRPASSAVCTSSSGTARIAVTTTGSR